MKHIFAALAVCLANAASALTVTFDHNPVYPNAGGGPATSNGFIYDYSTTYLGGNYLYLHSDSGILTSTIRAISGTTFTAKSIDVWGALRIFMSGSGPRPADDNSQAYFQWATSGIEPVATLTFTGVRNGATVATQSIGPTQTQFTSDSVIPKLKKLRLSSGFSHIDQLILTVNNPISGPYWNDLYDPFGPNTVWCNDWCASYRVDNLKVSAVPLPASGLLLIGAIAGLFGIKRRRITDY